MLKKVPKKVLALFKAPKIVPKKVLFPQKVPKKALWWALLAVRNLYGIMYEVDKDRMTMTRWRAIITLELLQVTFHLFNWLPLCSTQCVCVYEGYTMCVINTYLHVWASKVLVGKVSNWQSVVEESLHYERRLDWSFQVQVSLRLSGANVAVFNHTDRDNFLPSFLDLVALNSFFFGFFLPEFCANLELRVEHMNSDRSPWNQKAQDELQYRSPSITSPPGDICTGVKPICLLAKKWTNIWLLLATVCHCASPFAPNCCLISGHLQSEKSYKIGKRLIVNYKLMWSCSLGCCLNFEAIV